MSIPIRIHDGKVRTSIPLVVSCFLPPLSDFFLSEARDQLSARVLSATDDDTHSQASDSELQDPQNRVRFHHLMLRIILLDLSRFFPGNQIIEFDFML